MNKENIGKMTLKANKRNPKGETPLHVACIRNNIVAVKKLLKVPGITLCPMLLQNIKIMQEKTR